MFIFSLPAIVGAALAIVVFALFSIGLFLLVHPFYSADTSDETRQLANSAATRIGVIHAVVIGMMFSNVALEYSGMIHAIEGEASALIRMHNALERQEDEKLEPAMKELSNYIRFIVVEQWPALRERKILAGDMDITGRQILDRVWESLKMVDPEPREELSRLLDEVEDFRNHQLFDAVGGALLPVFWYIAIVGFLITLLTLSLYPPSFRRCLLVSFYGAMVGVVLYGILVMNHPYSVGAGTSPDIFEWLLEATL